MIRFIAIAISTLMLVSCTKTIYVDQNGTPIPKQVNIRTAIDPTTGCVLNVSQNTYGDVYSQKFRADGKPDCPKVDQKVVD